MSQHEAGPPASETRPTTQPTAGTYLRQGLPIYYALLLAILTVFTIYLLIELKQVLLLLFISMLFASATAAPAAYLQRLRIPEAISVVLIYLLALAIVAGLVYFVAPPLVGQLARFGDNIPAYVDRYERLRDAYEKVRQEYPSLAPFEDHVSVIGSRIVNGVGQRLTELPTRLFGLFLDVLSVFVISMLLVTNRRRLLNRLLTLVHPKHRPETERVVRQMWKRIGYYLRAKLIVMLIVGAITYGVLLLIGVPFPLLLSIVVALGQLIPRAGPWLARLPLFAIAAFEGWTTFGLTIAASIGIENLKGYVISPVVEGNQLDIHPLLIFISVLVGSTLLGLGGAFVAVPAAAMIQVVFDEVIIPWRERQLAQETGTASSTPPIAESQPLE